MKIQAMFLGETKSQGQEVLRTQLNPLNLQWDQSANGEIF